MQRWTMGIIGIVTLLTAALSPVSGEGDRDRDSLRTTDYQRTRTGAAYDSRNRTGWNNGQRNFRRSRRHRRSWMYHRRSTAANNRSGRSTLRDNQYGQSTNRSQRYNGGSAADNGRRLRRDTGSNP